MNRFKIFTMTCIATAILSGGHALAQWTPVGTPGFSPGGLSNWQHLMVDENNDLFISFNDEGLPSGQGTVMRYDGSSWVSIGTPGFTPGIAHHSWFDKGPAGTYYFSFADGNDMSKAAVMKYNGSTWNSIGSSLSTGECQYSNIKVINDTAYLAFADNGEGGTLKVLKYTGSAWVPVGGPGPISAGSAYYISMVPDRHDTLYIAYQDGPTGFVNVVKFNGTSWVNVGSGPFMSLTMGSAYNISMAFDHNNMPYVAYWNPAPMGPSASVQKFDGTNWVNVGTPSFTTTIVNFTSLAFGTNDTAYLAFTESTTGWKASVMKFDGTNWNYVGTPGFSAGTSAHTSLATDANGNLYVGYFDDGNGGKTTVMKYETCTAPTISAVAASDTDACKGDTITLTVTGSLNDATGWQWHTGSCTGTLADTGATIHVAPNDTTTYYVTGLGGCVLSSGCTPININVDVLPVPTISASGAVLTSSASGGNQWLHSGTAISGATGTTYTVTQSGWYSVSTSDGHCTQTSDSVYVIGVGVNDVQLTDNIKVFPVPCTDVLHLDISAAFTVSDNWQATIYDNVGRVVSQQTLTANNNTIDVHNLPAGLLQVMVSTPYGKQTFKVVKSAQ